MKVYTFILLFIGILFIQQLHSQNNTYKRTKNKFSNNLYHKSPNQLNPTYVFSKSTMAYSDLSGAISLNGNSNWDDPEYKIFIGFPFKLYDKTLDTIYIGYGVGGLLSDLYTMNTDAKYIIAPFEADLIDRGIISGVSTSPISYKVEGSAGNRILKIEYKNAGFYMEYDSLGTTNDYVNFQAWLYEGSNKIEFHYGASQLAHPNIDYEGESGAVIGITDIDITNSYLLTGPVANPTTTGSGFTISGTPADSTVYTFIWSPVGIKNTKKEENISEVFPNPISNFGTITLSHLSSKYVTVNIYNISGRLINTIKDIETKNIKIEKGELNSGLYFYQILDNNNTISTGKFVIQ